MAAAEKEGALNVIALPHDWSNYGDVISGFKKKYPKIKINEQNPNASSKEEVDAGKTNKGTDAAPDVYDLGLAVASTSTDNFASYKVQAWDKIPDSVKDKDGKYYADYTGIMSIGWNADKYGDIKSINDLTDPKFAGTVALNGKPAEAGAAFNGYLMINQLAGGDIKNLQPGLDFFKKLKDCGNLTTVDVTDGTIDSGQTGELGRVEMVHFLGALARVDVRVACAGMGGTIRVTVQLPANELPAGLAIGAQVVVAPRPIPALAV